MSDRDDTARELAERVAREWKEGWDGWFTGMSPDTHTYCFTDLADAVQGAILEDRAERGGEAGGWVRVEKGTPEEGEEVIAWVAEDDNEAVICKFKESWGGFGFSGVTHWQPLPVPPPAEEGGEG